MFIRLNMSNPIIKIEEDLTDIMMEAEIRDTYIIGNGGGSIPHKHLNELDGDSNLGKQKYSSILFICRRSNR